MTWGAAGIVDYLEGLGGASGPGLVGRAALDRAFADIAIH